MESITVETWQQLATIPIAVAVALAAVQFAKVFYDGHTRAWQRLSAAVAVLVMVGATVVGNIEAGTAAPTFSFAVVLAVINGLIAGVAASRTFDVARTAVDKVRE